MRPRARCRPRLLALVGSVLAFCAYCYYYTTTPPSYPKPVTVGGAEDAQWARSDARDANGTEAACGAVTARAADLDTLALYPGFDFQPSWVRAREFWDRALEERYERARTDTARPPLKVVVVPHSHNDPGWLQTAEQSFEARSRRILDNAVRRLHLLRNMTFVWSEVALLHAWWERAHPSHRKALRELVKEGRLEIAGGGWVMPDEACTHLYSLLDQFIEGHQWVKSTLGVSVRTGWSIDPFGHGPTVPHLLDRSGLAGAVIQRIHYAWKAWLARRQLADFRWVPGWAGGEEPRLLVHNQPFDIYSIKASCGPHPAVCLGFDFRRVPGEYTEYTARYEEVTEHNVERKATALVGQYARIGSLTPHNVVLVPLGDDFRYEHAAEFDAQYANYMRMFAYIAAHRARFRADVAFGTPRDYFRAVRERYRAAPTLKGDFFVYADVFTEGRPAYWSGYFTTRPYLKLLARHLEHQLRTAEILFTLVWNSLRQRGERGERRLEAAERAVERGFERVVGARRALGLVQHHDAVTGTARAAVARDYGLKLLAAAAGCARLQEAALAATLLPARPPADDALQTELVWDAYGDPPTKLRVSYLDRNRVVVFNSLAESRTEVVTLRTNVTDVRVYDARRRTHVPAQVAPVLEVREGGRRAISAAEFEVMFEAALPALTAVTFHLERHENASSRCLVYCDDCGDPRHPDLFPTRRMMPGDIQLENSVLKLLIDRNTGLLREVYRKDSGKRNVVEMQFGAYRSAQRHSGAYLFMPDHEAPERAVLEGAPDEGRVVIVSGPVATEVTALYPPLLVHTVRLHHTGDAALARALRLDTVLDFESPPKNRDTELFMRIQTDIQNGEPPEFYTDQNGFQYQKRVKIDKLGIEANYYPITTMAWLQDAESRLTLVTEHAQGAAGFEPGRLEVMLDRRTLYDDFRGIGEGVLDSRRTAFRHYLLVEATPPPAPARYELPTARADRLARALSYPPHVYVAEGEVGSHVALAAAWPAGVHLVALRSRPAAGLERAPAPAALLVLQRPGAACAPRAPFTPATAFPGARLSALRALSLTGLHARADLASLADIALDPMELATYEIEF